MPRGEWNKAQGSLLRKKKISTSNVQKKKERGCREQLSGLKEKKKQQQLIGGSRKRKGKKSVPGDFKTVCLQEYLLVTLD